MEGRSEDPLPVLHREPKAMIPPDRLSSKGQTRLKDNRKYTQGGLMKDECVK